MPTLKEVEGQVNALIRQGRGDEKAHLVLPAVEARERVKNPKGRTRFIFETDSAECYAQLNAEKNRYIENVGNKSVAVTLFIMALQKYTDEELRLAAEGVEEIAQVESPVPKAEIPPMF